MIQYILKGWKEELDDKLNLEWKSLECTKYERNQVERTLWYQMYGFFTEQVAKGNYVESFRPFAESYIKSIIKSRCDCFESYG